MNSPETLDQTAQSQDLSAPPQPQEAPESAANTAEEVTAPQEENAPTQGEPARLTEEPPTGRLTEADLQSLSDEYTASGALSDATYQNLEARGYPRTLVETYIRGQQALMNEYRTSIYEQVGGENAYTAMTDWAGATFSESEIETYNSLITSGQKENITIAITSLKARYEAAHPGESAPLSGAASGPTSGQIEPYATQEELQKATYASLYGNMTEEQRAQHEARLLASTHLI